MRLAVNAVAGFIVVGLMAAAPAQPGLASDLTAESFARPPAIEGVVVSPSGARLALIVNGPKGYHQLGVMSLAPIGDVRVIAGFDDADVGDVRWVNDDRLVFSGFPREAEVRDGGAGIMAVNFDGSEPRVLIRWSRDAVRRASTIESRTLPYGWFVYSTVDDGGDDVLVYRRDMDDNSQVRGFDFARLNTRTGALKNLSYGMPAETRFWLLDRDGEPRVIVGAKNGREIVYWRPTGAATWTEVASFEALSDAGFTPVQLDDDGTLLVTANNGRDTSGLYRFNLAQRKLEAEPLLAIGGFDLIPDFVTDSKSGRMAGVHLLADRPRSIWFTPEMQAVQRGIDAALPAGRMNRLYCSRCESSRFFVVRSMSDRHPGEYFLFDRTKASLERISAARPWIEEATQGRRTFHRIQTEDGLSMPVIVTHPTTAEGNRASPAVVLVHGGPWSRGSDLRWAAEAQFLASRGYRVLEPAFRGSTGYGARLFRAGWKEWGRAMQDDLVQTVRWASKEGLVDPARVCIYGASYGGYAALMAPIRHPGAFRCAASFAGVTDIELMYSITWSDLSDAARRYSMPRLIGDKVKDADRLAEVSPLRRVAQINVPVLLAQGRADRRVPVDHATRFETAARAAGVQLEAVYYSSEGHGWFDPANHADFLRRLEALLASALQARPGAAP